MQQQSPAADPSETQAPNRLPAGQAGSMSNGSAAAGHMKRGAGVQQGGSILSAAPGSSTRSNGGIGSRKLEGSGPLASGPVGRASREHGFGLGPSGAAAAAASAAAAGSNAGRLGSSRAWGTGPSAAGPGTQAAAGSASDGSPTQCASGASGSGCDGDGYEEGVLRANSSSTGSGSGPLLQPGEGQRLSSSGSFGRSSSQQGTGESALVQLSSKHAQWEQELLEELARQREEHRASRAASRRSAMQQQLS